MDADLLMQTVADVLKKIAEYSISNRAEFEALVKKSLAMQQTDADPETGCMEFDIAKGSFSFRLTAPYSEERREAARRYAKENNAADRLK